MENEGIIGMIMRLSIVKSKVIMLIAIVALAGCEGDESASTFTSTPEPTPVPTPEPTPYKSTFKESGWNCSLSDSYCYVIEDALLVSGNISTGEEQAELIETSNTLSSLYQSSLPIRYKIVGNCMNSESSQDWGKVCFAIDHEASSGDTNIGTLSVSLSNDSSLFKFNFSAYGDQYDIPASATSDQTSELLQAYYSHKNYDCTATECTGFVENYTKDQKVLREDKIEVCLLNEVTCSQKAVFDWAASMSEELWPLFPENPYAYSPNNDFLSVAHECSNELTRTDAIFCPYYSIEFGLDPNKKANAMALVELSPLQNRDQVGTGAAFYC